MKKNDRFELYVSLTVALLSFPSLLLMTILPEKFIGLPLLYLVFQLNWMVASPVKRLEHALFRKTEFRWKRFIVHDFVGDPNIPIRWIYHQLLSYLYLIGGILLWMILYVDSFNESIGFNTVLMFGYCIGIGGTLMLTMVILFIVDSIRNTADYYVDSKFIR